MKPIYLLVSLFCIISAMVYSQEFKSAWLTGIQIGAPGAENDLSNCVMDINTRDDIEFVVVTGSLTETGSNSEFEKAKEVLDRLKVPYYAIPGAHDTRWSESGCTQFAYLLGNDNFIFDHNGTRHIGVNSSICWQGGGGHVSPQIISWLQQVLDTTNSSKEIYFYIHHPLNSTIDNWFQVSNLLFNKNVKVVFTGFTDAAANTPVNNILNFNGIPGVAGRPAFFSTTSAKEKSAKKSAKSWGYTFVESKADSILFYEITSDSLARYWGGISKNDTLPVSQIDSIQQKVFSENVKLKWQKELNTELFASLLTTEDKIFAVTKSGFVYCYDLDGNLKWEYDTGETILSKPVRDKDILSVATIEGDLFTFNANNGNVIQVLSIGETLTSQLIITDITYNGYKTKGVIVGTATGRMICYDIYSLELVWENNSATGLINTEPLLINDRIVYGSWDNHLYCIDAKNGQLNWKWQTPDQKAASKKTSFSYFSPAGCKPVSDEKNIFITAPDKNVTAIDLLLGRTVWRKNNFNSWESIGLTNDKNNLLIKSMKDKFYLVSPADGKIVKEIDAGYGFDTTPISPVEKNGNILLGAGNGNIYLVDSTFNVYPILYTGTARINTIKHIKDNLFVISNIDGKIFVIELN